MSNTYKVSMTIGRTVNLGNYESLRMEISAEGSIDGTEETSKVLDRLERGINRELAVRIKRNVEALRS